MSVGEATQEVESLPKQREQHFVLSHVDWELYEHLLRKVGDQPIRITYDRGALELMSPSFDHELCGRLIGRMVDMLTFELRIPIRGGRTTTFRREDLERGIEADDCFYIAHEPAIRSKRSIDLRVDPPPDLMIEIDITRSSLNRMEICAALGVPEIWRYDGTNLYFFVLNPDGQYIQSDRSLAFPFLTPEVIARFLSMRNEVDETTLLRQFVEWIRSLNLSGYGNREA